VLLEVKNLKAGYGNKQVLHDVSFSVNEGEIVALIGHNGAGKSTTLQATFGLITPSSGQVIYDGLDITYAPPKLKLEKGIYHIPQDRYIFNDLAVKDNLELSSFTMVDQSKIKINLKNIYNIFPVLNSRQNQLAGTLSGGERRLLGIAMGLLREPKLLMLDEPSSGLSPVAFQNVIKVIQDINKRQKTAVFIVEQNVKSAFKISERVYVMKAGSIILEETSQKLLERNEWWDLF